MWYALVVCFLFAQAITPTSMTTDSEAVACGWPADEFRGREFVIGGRVTGPHQHPWMVSLQDDEIGHFCGGTLINSRWVLTAAHCRHRLEKSPKALLALGLYSIAPHEASSYKVEIYRSDVRLFPHEDHRIPDRLSNDIMLIDLQRNITFNSGIRPICLPPGPESTPSHGTGSFAFGWGTSDRSLCPPLFSAYLHQEQVPFSHIDNNANDLSACQRRCYANSTCLGVNFDLSAEPGHRCFFVTNAAAQMVTKTDSIAYMLNRTCLECTSCKDMWTIYVNASSNAPVEQMSDENSLNDCRIACLLDGNCTGVDFSQENMQGTRCYKATFHPDDLYLMSMNGYNHYSPTAEFWSTDRSVLRQVQLNIKSHNYCETTQPSFIIDKNHMFCAGVTDGRRDTCDGDSGGPLLRQDDNGAWIQYGIISGGGEKCGLPDKPTIFTKVAAYLDWISGILASPDEKYKILESRCITARQEDTSCITASGGWCRVLNKHNQNLSYQACESCLVYHKCEGRKLIPNLRCPTNSRLRYGSLMFDQKKRACSDHSSTCDECG